MTQILHDVRNIIIIQQHAVTFTTLHEKQKQKFIVVVASHRGASESVDREISGAPALVVVVVGSLSPSSARATRTRQSSRRAHRILLLLSLRVCVPREKRRSTSDHVLSPRSIFVSPFTRIQWRLCPCPNYLGWV